MSNNIKANDNEFNLAFDTILSSANRHGINTTDPEIIAFCRHQAEVLAAEFATVRFYQSCLAPK